MLFLVIAKCIQSKLRKPFLTIKRVAKDEIYGLYETELSKPRRKNTNVEKYNDRKRISKRKRLLKEYFCDKN